MTTRMRDMTMNTAGTTTRTATAGMTTRMRDMTMNTAGPQPPGRPQPMSTLTMTTAKDPTSIHTVRQGPPNRRCPSASNRSTALLP